MAVNAPPDALRLTGTVIRLVRHLDGDLGVAVAGDVGLSEVTVLGSIDRGIDLASKIAHSLQLDPPRVTRIVERLVSRGLVTRGSDSSDRRRCPLALTPSGASILGTARTALTNSMRLIIDELPSGTQDQLVDSLEHVRLILER
jgi:DNA-binding MarR family transcriptional regulator